MSESTENKEEEFPWFDKKVHTVRIKTDRDEYVDIGNLTEACAKMKEDNKDMCDNIYYLCIAMTHDPTLADGFVLGYIARTIKDANEKENNSKWRIEHVSEEMPIKEYKHKLANTFREIAERLETSEDDSDIGIPIIRNSNNGNSLL